MAGLAEAVARRRVRAGRVLRAKAEAADMDTASAVKAEGVAASASDAMIVAAEAVADIDTAEIEAAVAVAGRRATEGQGHRVRAGRPGIAERLINTYAQGRPA